MFERLRRVHRAESKLKDQAHMAELLQEINLKLEVQVDGCAISTEDLVKLAPGQVLLLDYPLERQATAFLNGRPKFSGDIVATESKLAFTVRSETGDLMV